MKHIPLLAAGALALTASYATAAVGMLTDPSFEGTITSDGPPFVGSWEGFAGGGGAPTSTFSTTTPNTGAQSLELFLDAAGAFAGAFQDVPGVVAGNSYGWSGVASGATVGPGVEFRIEWVDGGGTVLSATPNGTTAPGDGVYAPFSLTGVAPVGAETARFVYAAQTFGGSPGTVYVDDVAISGTFVPEPTTTLLGGLGLLGLLIRRRR